MDGQTKLTRTNSSLLSSSPTIRSSIHSLSSVSEIAPDSDAEDLEEQKPHSRPLPSPVRSGVAAPVAAAFLLLYVLFAFFTSNDLATSENLLSALIFVKIFLCLLSRNKGLVSRNVNFFKQIYDEYEKRIRFLRFGSRTHSKPVQWFIGEAESEELESRKIVREGVEFYSNGDFYAGEFHKGRVTGAVTYKNN
ncbi:hypothetical protein SASPL_100355 [Salvia splendens]|uniref:Uncharacterized protein n=1 Tax=Salvia splendens TaxID=180675 RepID=A0A8X8YSJ9_SALSN|nr:uncharacterized protein LOC121757593 [Salvia splendens]KAG6435481.1 hypothetical protein SASPL_100355 [Salvia splendens]